MSDKQKNPVLESWKFGGVWFCFVDDCHDDDDDETAHNHSNDSGSKTHCC